MRLSVLAILTACASAAPTPVEVTVFSHCTTDVQGGVYTLTGSAETGTPTLIPAGGQVTFSVSDPSTMDLLVYNVGATPGGANNLIDLQANDDPDNGGSQLSLNVNAPSLAPGVVVTPSGTLGGSCMIVDCGTSYMSLAGQTSTEACASGTAYALDICQ